MNQDEHQRERMRAWARLLASGWNADLCDKKMAEFDKRFPAPVAPAVAFDRPNVTLAKVDEAELATLRQKARLWDAVKTARIGIEHNFVYGFRCKYKNIELTSYYPTPEEAVQAAIDAGALK